MATLGETTGGVKRAPVSYADIRAEMWESIVLYRQLCNKYKCSVCLELYPTIYITVPCEHFVCLDCASRLPGDEAVACPTCQEKLASPRVRVSKVLTRDVSNDLKLHCVYAAPHSRSLDDTDGLPTSSPSDAGNGCGGGGGTSGALKTDETKTLGDKKEVVLLSVSEKDDVCVTGPVPYGRWLQHCADECLVRDYACPKCAIQLRFNRYAAHATNDCPNRLVQCGRCDVTAPMSLGALELHRSVCDGEQVACPNACRTEDASVNRSVPTHETAQTQTRGGTTGGGGGSADDEKPRVPTQEARGCTCADCGNPKTQTTSTRHSCDSEDVGRCTRFLTRASASSSSTSSAPAHGASVFGSTRVYTCAKCGQPKVKAPVQTQVRS